MYSLYSFKLTFPLWSRNLKVRCLSLSLSRENDPTTQEESYKFSTNNYSFYDKGTKPSLIVASFQPTH